jgi:hypothetical protein
MVVVPVFSLNGQGQNHHFMSHFILPSPTRTCMVDGDASVGMLPTAMEPSWVASITLECYFLSFPYSPFPHNSRGVAARTPDFLGFLWRRREMGAEMEASYGGASTVVSSSNSILI